jgi:hypothetical protein
VERSWGEDRLKVTSEVFREGVRFCVKEGVMARGVIEKIGEGAEEK